jgi:hypothetical protein
LKSMQKAVSPFKVRTTCVLRSFFIHSASQ